MNTITAASGNDTVFATTSFALGAGAEVETLSTTYHSSPRQSTSAEAMRPRRSTAISGVNVLDGKGGNDLMVGFDGADTFAFTTALGGGNVDTISDFLAGTDKIALDDAVITAIGGLGTLNASAFVTGTAAVDTDDRIINNSPPASTSMTPTGTAPGLRSSSRPSLPAWRSTRPISS